MCILSIILSIHKNEFFIKLNTYCVPTTLRGAGTTSLHTARFLLSPVADRCPMGKTVCPYLQAGFPCFQLSFKLRAILGSVEKSALLCPAWVINHFFVPCTMPVSHGLRHPSSWWAITVNELSWRLFYSRTIPTSYCGDAGDVYMSMCYFFSMKRKVEILRLVRKKITCGSW